MSDRIEIYRTTVRRKWRWRYVAANGNILADSGQGYADKRDALTGLSRVTGRSLSHDGEVLYGIDSVGLLPVPVVEVAK